MSEQDQKVEKRLRHAGFWVGGGLVAEFFTLLFSGPGAFLAFVTLGGLGILIGVVLYLWALFS